MMVNDYRPASTKGLLLRVLSLLSLPGESRPLTIIAMVLWRGLGNLRHCLEVIRLAKHPQFAEIVKNNPKFAFKFLFSDYLARGLTVSERASSLLHHYRYLEAKLSDQSFRQFLDRNVLLHQFGGGGGSRIALTLGSSRLYNKEGEASLNLLVDGASVYLLSFTIIPGWVVKSAVSDSLLITRIQGVKGCYDHVSFATKTLHDVAPCALLLAALQGIADAFGIVEIAGVCATRQPCYTAETAVEFKLAYDDFFAELGIAKNASGFFLSQVPIVEKPLALIKRGHKLRKKEKRAFKRQVAEDVCRLLQEGLAARGTGAVYAGLSVQLAAVLES
jgi:uncharacterized protein VirK/YbjX